MLATEASCFEPESWRTQLEGRPSAQPIVYGRKLSPGVKRLEQGHPAVELLGREWHLDLLIPLPPSPPAQRALALKITGHKPLPAVSRKFSRRGLGLSCCVLTKAL